MAQDFSLTSYHHHSARGSCSRHERLHRLCRRQSSAQGISNRAATEENDRGVAVPERGLQISRATMANELDRAEQKVEDRSAPLKKELGLCDLVLTQILFIVGSSWVGTAATLGHSHSFFWLLAILLFYIPQAAVVIYLNRLMPLDGGLYQWAKFAFNEFAGFIVAWNLWLLSIMVIALGGMFVTTNLSYAIGDAGAWMRNTPWCVSLISCALVGGLGWTGVRGLSLGKWLHNIGGFAMLLAYAGLIVLPLVSLIRGDLSAYRPLQIAAPTM